MDDYLPRSVDSKLAEMLKGLPALMILGPRAVGKTTTAARLAAHVMYLDDPFTARMVNADPDGALRGLPEPVLLDEWQEAPDLLAAVKRSVDADRRPGRYLLTGSVRARLSNRVWPGTGRVTPVSMHPMTAAEVRGRNTKPLLDRLSAGEPPVPAPDSPDLRGYIEMALQGGFPPTLGLDEQNRHEWMRGYLEMVFTRDLEAAGGNGRDPDRFGRYFEAHALDTAGLAEHKTLYDAARIDRKTALAYDRLLRDLMLIQEAPAWLPNRLKRLVVSRKRYLVDPALLAGVLGLDAAAVLRDSNLLGRLLDTFAAAQLRSEAVTAESRPRLCHLRTHQGRREVDIVAELAGRRIAGDRDQGRRRPDAARRPLSGLAAGRLRGPFRGGGGAPHRPALLPAGRPDMGGPHLHPVGVTPAVRPGSEAGGRPGAGRMPLGRPSVLAFLPQTGHNRGQHPLSAPSEEPPCLKSSCTPRPDGPSAAGPRGA